MGIVDYLSRLNPRAKIGVTAVAFSVLCASMFNIQNTTYKLRTEDKRDGLLMAAESQEQKEYINEVFEKYGKNLFHTKKFYDGLDPIYESFNNKKILKSNE